MHKPVMLKEVLDFAMEVEPRFILDGTFGRGGHTGAFLNSFPHAQIVAFDQDQDAISYGEKVFADKISDQRLKLIHANFHSIASLAVTPANGFDVILLDLGVSSPQLDQAERGFSFYNDGPLDMRMNNEQELTAADIVNNWSEVELLELFTRYGEVSRPGRVVRALIHDRKQNPFTRTLELASLIERVEGWSRRGHHPATRYFQALRIAVNNELAGLESCIPDLMRALREGGRLIVITFHSLEDRIIKYAFREHSELGRPLVKKVITPSREEELENPRARSAKLRVFQRGNIHESTVSS